MILREPRIEDKEEILRIYQEYLSSELIEGVDRFEGIRNLGHLSNLTFEEWLNELEYYKKEENLPKDFAPQTTYLAIKDNKIVGFIDIRWKAVPKLLGMGGFIGYSIVPSQRGKGYGREMLKLALKEIPKTKYEKVLITCKELNIASKKVIEKNGGILENTYYNEENNNTYLRYWIDIK
jgi:predicted acetyltransferase